MDIRDSYAIDYDVILYKGSCYDFVKTIPDKEFKLIVTSPPYNIGKSYEKKGSLVDYYQSQEKIIDQCVRLLADDGSICWQTGNYVDKSEITPLDLLLYPIFVKNGLKLRNRIIWHYGHGLHASKRFSGRYETILWFTKGDKYTFSLDPIRVPQKYPQKKHFKGPNAGQLSCNPLGKNPSDVWDIPNVKSNHIEKTNHPCQFPVELIERLVLSMTNPGDSVFDPFMGSGSAIVAAVKNGRRGVGCDIIEDYVAISENRILSTFNGSDKTRPMFKPIYDPNNPKLNLNYPNTNSDQMKLFEKEKKYEDS